MRQLINVFKAASKLSENALGFSHYLSRRNKYSFQVDVNWKALPRFPVYHPEISGDLDSISQIDQNAPYGFFGKSTELKNAGPRVKNVFSLKYQMPLNRFRHYARELAEKVKNHPYDNKSKEVNIAWLTGNIRFLAKQIEEAKNRKKRLPLVRKYKYHLVQRQKQLDKLRKQDYKKFEWLLEQLNIVYRPTVQSEEQIRTRKNSLMKLVQLQQEKLKEKNLAKLKMSLDKQKVPFLEEKIKKLKWIKEMEEKNKVPKTVSEADIESCMKRLEEVKIEVEKRVQRGYERKIHPYTIEPYFDKLLKEKEKAAELIREPEIGSEKAEAS